MEAVKNQTTRNTQKVQWHPAFVASFQIELEEEKENLLFEAEHLLGKKPMQIDLLIIKKVRDIAIEKNIGKRFRQHNIIEYKGPTDFLSLSDFYKVYGYTCFYQSDSEKSAGIKPDELTITFVSSRYPCKLLKHLKKARGISTREIESGIYYLDGDEFPMQLIVTKSLSQKTNLWLSSLKNDLQEEAEIEKIAEEYEKHKESKLYQAVMDTIIRANWERMEEAKKKMCNAFRELFAKELEEGQRKSNEIAREEGRKAGTEIGTEIGIGKMLRLISAMDEAGETEAIPRLSRDKEFLAEMYEKYKIEEK